MIENDISFVYHQTYLKSDTFYTQEIHVLMLSVRHMGLLRCLNKVHAPKPFILWLITTSTVLTRETNITSKISI